MAFERSAALPYRAGRPVRDDGAREVYHDHERKRGKRPPGGFDVELDPAREPCDCERCHADRHEHEKRRLRERCQVLRLAVAVEVRRVGGLRRETDGEERQERRDEVGAASALRRRRARGCPRRGR